MSKVSRFATGLALALSAASCAGPVTPPTPGAGAATVVAAVAPNSMPFYLFVCALVFVLLFAASMLMRKPSME